MTPKEKADELYNRYEGVVWDMFVTADKKMTLTTLEENIKICALIAVDEVLKSMAVQQCNEDEYWQEVRNEIEKL